MPDEGVGIDEMAKDVSVRTNERSEETEMEAVGVGVDVGVDVGVESVWDMVLLRVWVGKLIVISVVGVLAVPAEDTGGEVLGGGVY